MARFNIIQSDPVVYKDQILEFWKEYLPGTPPGRFEWMQTNPAGPAIWFFAFDNDTNELAGTISIMPREMVLEGRIVKAGIVGDFMVSNNYRVFGPALSMQKIVLESMSSYGFDYVYTVPNQASLKMNLHAGYINAVKLVHLIKPVCSAQYLQKYLNDKPSTYIGWVLDIVLKLFSKETYILSSDNCDEIMTVNNSFDVLWNEVQKLEGSLIGNRSVKYIDWRYLKNPVTGFRIIALKRKSDTVLLGYIIFSVINGKVEIYDVLSLKKRYKSKLLKKLIHVARKEKCKAIYMRLAENSLDISDLRRFMFFNANNEISVLVFGEDVSIFSQWCFSEGDRNS